MTEVELLPGCGHAAGACMALHCGEDAEEEDHILQIGNVKINLVLCNVHLERLKRELKL